MHILVKVFTSKNLLTKSLVSKVYYYYDEFCHTKYCYQICDHRIFLRSIDKIHVNLAQPSPFLTNLWSVEGDRSRVVEVMSATWGTSHNNNKTVCDHST